MADTENKIEVTDQMLKEAESLCKWAAARAGAIVILPGLGTMSLIANDVYMVTIQQRVVTTLMALAY